MKKILNAACIAARELARDLDPGCVQDIDLVRSLELDRACAIVNGFARARERTHARADELASILASARIPAGRYVASRGDSDIGDPAKQLVIHLVLALGMVDGLADTFTTQRGRQGMTGHERRRTVHVSPSAARLLAMVTRLLPPAERSRYGQEFSSELWELGHVGANRRHQLGYAARQTLHVVQLRGAVLAPRRRGASR